MGTQVTYRDPFVNVNTAGVPGGDGGGFPGIDPFFINMAKKKLQFEDAMRQRALAPQYHSDAAPDWGAEEEKIRDRNYKKALQDADLNPPKKMISGANINPGYIEDTSMLPVSMRPKNASFAPAEENTAHVAPGGTGGFDPVAAEKTARADLRGPGGSGMGGDYEAEGAFGSRRLSDKDWLERRQAQRGLIYGMPRG